MSAATDRGPARPAPPNVLSIAGVDPSGGAGVFADLKTFAALGAYGTGVVAALTAQNTRAVTGIHEVPPEFLALQLDTLFDDVRIDAVKIGMLATPALIEVVAATLARESPAHVVLDPVMVAKSGARLLRPDAVATLVAQLVPRATLLTPNLPEAEALLGRAIVAEPEPMADAARALLALGSRAVLLKGGHGHGPTLVDVLVDAHGVDVLRGPRIDTRNTHGTGCTLSSAIAALLPQRASLRSAVHEAREWLLEAIRQADRLDVGRGHGPLHHGWRTDAAPVEAAPHAAARQALT
jgi:hydroxymethylpyrimidine/phosphomethylpyrimidine kinase